METSGLQFRLVKNGRVANWPALRAHACGAWRSLSKLLGCLAQGGTIQGIARQLQISRQTVRKCIQAPRFPEFQRVPRTKSAIDAYRPYLRQRWQEGYRSTDQLWKELQERGFAGSWMMVYRWVQLQKEGSAETLVQAQPQTKTSANKKAPRHLAWLFLHDPEQVGRQEQLTLSRLRQEKSVDQVYELAQQFVAMVKERNAQPMDTWLWNCQLSGISAPFDFCPGTGKGRVRSSRGVNTSLEQWTCGRKNKQAEVY